MSCFRFVLSIGLGLLLSGSMVGAYHDARVNLLQSLLEEQQEHEIIVADATRADDQNAAPYLLE